MKKHIHDFDLDKDYCKTCKIPFRIDIPDTHNERCNRVLNHNGGMYHCLAKGKHLDRHLFELPDVDTRIIEEITED